ncbi:MAG TPA: MFS transporter [Spirochaetia bacterium]|nr:MFS transporter [Spirochaetia bacterium]HRZ63494.1 MFS transporter [Spirochaetia bacterium]
MIVPVLNRFLHWAAIGLMSPVLVLMLLSKGVELDMAGIVLAASSAAVVILELPTGILSDLVGRRRVYLLSILVAMGARLCILLSRGPAALGLAFLVFGISRALASGSIEADYIDEFIARRGREKLHSLISAMGLGETAGLALGALAGGWIPVLWARLLPEANRYDGVIIAQLAVLVALLALTLCTRAGGAAASGAEGGREGGIGVRGYETDRGGRARLGAFLAESRSFLRGDGALPLLLAGAAAWGFSFNAVEVFWQPRLEALAGGSGDTRLFGLVNGGYFLAAMLGNALVAALLARRALPSLGLAAALRALVGLAVMGLALQASVGGFAACFLGLMCLNGMMGVPESVAFNSRIPETARATFLSLSSLMVQLGGIAGALAFGLASRFAPIGSLWLGAGAAFAASALLLVKAGRAAEAMAAPARAEGA